jgi:putative spermidine/putrescine transport system permease protein
MLGRIGFVPQVLYALTGRPWLSGTAYQFGGLVAAYVYFEIPRATLSLESSFKKFDLQLEAAARSLGAGRWQRFRLVMLPLLSPALISAFAVTFSVSLGSFGVVLILSRRFSVLPVQIFEQLTAFLNTGLAAAMSMVLVVVAFSVNYGLQAWADRRLGGFHGPA